MYLVARWTGGGGKSLMKPSSDSHGLTLTMNAGPVIEERLPLGIKPPSVGLVIAPPQG